MTRREKELHIHRPPVRRLSELDNDELQALFVIRSTRIATKLKGHDFWDNEQIVYWGDFLKLQADLYEVMLEIQSRYPKNEIHGYELLLPLPNTELWCREKFGLDYNQKYDDPIHEGNVIPVRPEVNHDRRTTRHNVPRR